MNIKYSEPPWSEYPPGWKKTVETVWNNPDQHNIIERPLTLLNNKPEKIDIALPTFIRVEGDYIIQYNVATLTLTARMDSNFPSIQIDLISEEDMFGANLNIETSRLLSATKGTLVRLGDVSHLLNVKQYSLELIQLFEI